jgi:hypothetical protein
VEILNTLVAALADVDPDGSLGAPRPGAVRAAIALDHLADERGTVRPTVELVLAAVGPWPDYFAYVDSAYRGLLAALRRHEPGSTLPEAPPG